MDDYQIIFCTTPDLETARLIAGHLVEKNLAACCNLVPAVESIYRWQDKIEHEQEILMLIKSTVSKYQDIETAIMDLHPYEVPEIIATPIQAGSGPYLEWITATMKGIVTDGT